MPQHLLKTGVELRVATALSGLSRRLGPPSPGEAMIEAQVFADLKRGGQRFRVGGTVTQGEVISLSEDPTSNLVQYAHEAREHQLGDLLGDLR